MTLASLNISRLQSFVLTVAALTIAANSFVPPWVGVHPMQLSPGPYPGGVSAQGEAARVAVTTPLGSYPVNEPPTNSDRRFVRVDYGRLILYHLATLALVVPFFVWRRRSVPPPTDDAT